MRAGWVNRALIHEAVASRRLNGAYVAPNDLILMVGDTLDRIPDQDVGRAFDIHQMLTTLTRRNPQHLFNPKRLIALTRLRLRGCFAPRQWPLRRKVIFVRLTGGAS